MSSDSISPAVIPVSPKRTLALVLAAFSIVVLGSRIPAPGVAMSVLSDWTVDGSGDGMMARLSIFSLGVAPLLLTLAHVELLRLVVPRVARWEAASARNAFRMGVIVKLVVLAVTGLQGYGVMNALAATGWTEPSAVSTVVGILSFMAASAVLIALADAIRLPGLENGLWALLIAPYIGQLIAWFAALFEATRSGMLPASAWVAPVAFLLCAVAAIAFAFRALTGRADRGRAARALPLSILLWPPFLADFAANYAFLVPAMLASEWAMGSLRAVSAITTALTAAFIPLFVFACHRRFLRDRPGVDGGRGVRPILLAVAGVQISVCVVSSAPIWAHLWPALPDGKTIVVLVTVLLALWTALTGRSGVTFRDPACDGRSSGRP